MRGVLASLAKPLAGPADQARATTASADYWQQVWRACQSLRMQIDQLAIHAAQQARLARQRAHPDSNPTPEETQDDR